MKVMILAAGRGERLRPLTDTNPKPLIPILDKPLLQIQIENLKAAGFREIVINVSYLGQKIIDYFQHGQKIGVSITYSVEENRLESGGGIVKALPLLGDEPFLLVNADVLTNYPFAQLKSIPCEHAHIVLVNNPEHNPQGDFCLSNRTVLQAGEQMLTYSGIALCNPSIFNSLKVGKFPLRIIFDQLIKAKKITGEHYHGKWFDVGTIDRLKLAEQWVKQNSLEYK